MWEERKLLALSGLSAMFSKTSKFSRLRKSGLRYLPLLNLYFAVMQDIFNQNEESRESELARIDAEIAKVQEQLFKVDEKYVDGSIEKDSYERLKTRYDQNLNQLQRQRFDVQGVEKGFECYVRYGLSLITDLGTYFNGTSLEGKAKDDRFDKCRKFYL